MQEMVPHWPPAPPFSTTSPNVNTSPPLDEQAITAIFAQMWARLQFDRILSLGVIQ
jgi:hypothetical protein